MNDFINKVYINGENIKIGSTGWTTLAYKPGTYYVEIKDLDQIITCYKMFFNCRCLVSVPLFNTSNVKDMACMFEECEYLEYVPVFDTKNVTDMSFMFYSCKKLKNVGLFNTQNVTDMSKMFYNCYKLEYVPVFNISSLKSKTFMFYNCNSLNEKTQQKWTQILMKIKRYENF